MLEMQYLSQFSLDCVNQKLITGKAPFVFLLLYLHFMKPSGIINMLKVSLVLFVILQQKKKLFLLQVGETIGLGEEGGRPGCALGWNRHPWVTPWALSGRDLGRALGGLAPFWQAWTPAGRRGVLRAEG